MNNEQLKDGIRATIKENGVNAITGELLQQVLIAMVNALGTGYQFVGVATPNADPGTTDTRLCYLGVIPGTYTHFGGIEIKSGESAFLTFDTEWRKITIVDSPVIWVDVMALTHVAPMTTKIEVFKALRDVILQYTNKMVVLANGENIYYAYHLYCAADSKDYILIRYMDDERCYTFSMEASFDPDTLDIIGVDVRNYTLPGMAPGIPTDKPNGIYVYRKSGTYNMGWVENCVEVANTARPEEMQKVFLAYYRGGTDGYPLYGFKLPQKGQRVFYPVNAEYTQSKINLRFVDFPEINIMEIIIIGVRPDGVTETQQIRTQLNPL